MLKFNNNTFINIFKNYTHHKINVYDNHIQLIISYVVFARIISRYLFEIIVEKLFAMID